jgi:hypothetical protein
MKKLNFRVSEAEMNEAFKNVIAAKKDRAAVMSLPVDLVERLVLDATLSRVFLEKIAEI